MNFAILLWTRRDPAVLSLLTGDLFHRGLFPDLLWSEPIGDSTVHIRLQIQCSHEVMEALKGYWRTYLPVQTLLVTPLSADCTPPDRVAPEPA
jgi:hypothetical protein